MDHPVPVKQLEVFHAQMALAARLRRPVSVHCVKAHGKIVDLLRGTETGSKKGGGSERGGGHGEAGHGGFRQMGQAGRERGEGRLPPRMALQ